MKEDFNEIDRKIEQIYENSGYNKIVFQNAYSSLKNKRVKTKIVTLSVLAAAITTICIISISFFLSNDAGNNIASNDNAINENSVDDKRPSEDDVYIIPQGANILLAENSSASTVQLPNGLSYTKISVVEESDCIAMLKLDKILYGMNYIPKTNKYVYPVTVSKFTVEKNYKGNLSGQIKVATDTETLLPIEDYAKGGFREQAIKFGYDKMTEEERKNTYVKVPTLRNYTKLKENTYYIAYMKYNEDAEMYGIFDYCFFEYNKDTNQIRIPGTNNWEEFELKDYNSNDFHR